MSKDKPFEKYELKIKAWEAESKDVAENAVVRLSETLMPDGSAVLQHQLVDESLFTISIETKKEFQVVNVNSEYIDSFSKLLNILNELMFGGPEEQLIPDPRAATTAHGQKLVPPHGDNKPPPAEELDEDEGSENGKGGKGKG